MVESQGGPLIKRLILGILSLFSVGIFSVPAHADAITLTPGDATWVSNQTSNLSLSEIEALTGLTDVSQLYEEPVGGDASDFLLTTDIILDPTLQTVLVVKDGNQPTPPPYAQYLFDLTALGWNGTDDIQLDGFWEGVQGAISHVAVYQGGGTTTVPEPLTLLLFGTGVVGVGLVSRRRRI